MSQKGRGPQYAWWLALSSLCLSPNFWYHLIPPHFCFWSCTTNAGHFLMEKVSLFLFCQPSNLFLSHFTVSKYQHWITSPSTLFSSHGLHVTLVLACCQCLIVMWSAHHCLLPLSPLCAMTVASCYTGCSYPPSSHPSSPSFTHSGVAPIEKWSTFLDYTAMLSIFEALSLCCWPAAQENWVVEQAHNRTVVEERRDRETQIYYAWGNRRPSSYLLPRLWASACTLNVHMYASSQAAYFCNIQESKKSGVDGHVPAYLRLLGARRDDHDHLCLLLCSSLIPRTCEVQDIPLLPPTHCIRH